MTQSEERRFMRDVSLSALSCWTWTGPLHENGYGLFTRYVAGFKRTDPRRVLTRRAHRLSYEMFVGPIPRGLELDHLCRNRACVRPDHLEPVTHKVNCRRSPLTMAKKRGDDHRNSTG